MAPRIHTKLQAELETVKGRSPILQPVAVVKWARKHRKSALYSQFDWNNTSAGHKYRLQQARQLIVLHIVSEDRTPKVVSLSIDRVKPNGGYRAVADVLDNKALSAIMLSDALAELKRVQLKYQRIRALKPVWAAVARIANGRSARPARRATKVAQRRAA